MRKIIIYIIAALVGFYVIGFGLYLAFGSKDSGKHLKPCFDQCKDIKSQEIKDCLADKTGLSQCIKEANQKYKKCLNECK
jgi:hypothetical protein